MRSNAKILLVDDEPKHLSALRRQLARKYDVSTATGGDDALLALESEGPFSVVVSDMRMPLMDGIEFLREVKERDPRITRIMLTGDSDQETAIAAVNQGSIFRFLQKPCPKDVLIAAIEDGMAEYFVKAEVSARVAAAGSQQAIVDLFSHLNHELRTPLNHIIGFAQLLESTVPGDTSYQEYVGHIQQSGSDLLDIVSSILTLGKAKSGDIEMRRSLLSIDDLANGCRSFVEQIGTEKRISFETAISSSFPDLFVERDTFMQILFNLLSNAVKFNKIGGTVRLRADFNLQGDPVIEISDTGIGIPAEYLGRVTEPFGPAEAVERRAHDGVGMGLPLAKTLTELHDGILILDSLLGHGTTVTIRLTKDSVWTGAGPAAEPLAWSQISEIASLAEMRG